MFSFLARIILRIMVSMNILLLLCLLGLFTGLVCAAAEANPGGASSAPVRYEDFGAVGDGKTDDFDPIVRAHALANEQGRPVRAKDGATYYIGGADRTAIIQTDTDFGEAEFIIDDRRLENIKAHVFEVRSSLEPIEPAGMTSLTRNQPRVDMDLPGDCLVVVTDRNVKRFIRRGKNVNSGAPQTDVFRVDKAGRIDPDTPILWDFEQVTDVIAYPIDPRRLTIGGGRFTTIANQADSKYNYHARGIAIRRSNVDVVGVEHRITGEGETGAPYGGFINIHRCADVTVRDCLLTGHKTYETVGRAGEVVPMGSYDIHLAKAMNVTFLKCLQTNDINDRRYWGLMASNYCKNLILDGCVFSRFDAHMGVANATIRNCKLGHMGVHAIGFGTLLIENTTVLADRLVNLRPDYGSTWRGEFIIRNSTFRPGNGREMRSALFVGHNDGRHDYGYTCYMPRTITIDGLRIDDANHPDDYDGPVVFGNFNPNGADPSYKEKYPYIKTERVILKDVTTASGQPVRLSDTPNVWGHCDVVRRPH